MSVVLLEPSKNTTVAVSASLYALWIAFTAYPLLTECMHFWCNSQVQEQLLDLLWDSAAAFHDRKYPSSVLESLHQYYSVLCGWRNKTSADVKFYLDCLLKTNSMKTQHTCTDFQQKRPWNESNTATYTTATTTHHLILIQRSKIDLNQSSILILFIFILMTQYSSYVT